jgi:hypothetical protein
MRNQRARATKTLHTFETDVLAPRNCLRMLSDQGHLM